MRADITKVKEALDLALTVGKSTFGTGTVDFLTLMLGAQHTAIADLCEHVKALEERLDNVA